MSTASISDGGSGTTPLSPALALAFGLACALAAGSFRLASSPAAGADGSAADGSAAVLWTQELTLQTLHVDVAEIAQSLHVYTHASDIPSMIGAA